MNKKILSISLICILSLFTGCSKENKISSTENDATTANTSVKSTTFHYTGETSENITTENVPFMAIVENSPNSRPQSGLSFADIIYETSAEGGIPRFMAIFQSNYPDTIGPIRSVRPYFLDIATENNLPFAHCGGSADALAAISQNQTLMSINEISNGKYFWRDNSRNAPHNLYTSSKNILDSISDKNFTYSPLPFANFDQNYYLKENLTPISNIYLTINRLYNTSYTYFNELYVKSMDGETALDASTNLPLSFSNIVIQKTNITLQKDNTHLNIDLLGEGEGYIFSKGRYVNVLWKKENANDKTTFYDYDGNIVPLSPGKTIWHIVDNNNEILFN